MLTSLPIDLIDRILTFLPDFRTLLATVLTSKHLYAIFKAHPNSTVSSVAYNIIGPALPQALKVLRHTPHDDHFKPPPQQAWLETDSVGPISGKEARDLVKNAAVVSALEDLFSSKHKDRNSRKSQLDPVESWRFCRAVYRAMLFSNAFPTEDVQFHFENASEEAEVHSRVRRAQNMLLAGLSNEEIYSLHSVAIFLTELAKWTEIAEFWHASSAYDFGDIALACGPAAILEAFQTTPADVDRMREFRSDLEQVIDFPVVMKQYLIFPLEEILDDREMKRPFDNDFHWKSILHNIDSHYAECQRCNSICGFNLWNDTTWDKLRGVDTFAPLFSYPSYLHRLKGMLANSVVPESMWPALPESEDMEQDYTKLLLGIYRLRTRAYISWNKEDWLCKECITEIIGSHLHLWILDRLKDSGQEPPDDCRYGYDCIEQTKSEAHALFFNHLCEPTAETTPLLHAPVV